MTVMQKQSRKQRHGQRWCAGHPAVARYQLPTIMITGYGDVLLAVRAMKAGAAGSSRSRSVAMSCLPPSIARWNGRAARPRLLTCAMRQEHASPASRSTKERARSGELRARCSLPEKATARNLPFARPDGLTNSTVSRGRTSNRTWQEAGPRGRSQRTTTAAVRAVRPMVGRCMPLS